MLRLRDNDVAWSDLGHEIVILDLRSSRYFSATGAATTLVSLLVKGASRDELVEHILATFDIDGVTAETDVDEFIAELERRRLLVRVKGAR